MGSGAWSTAVYASSTAKSVAAGTNFAYSTTTTTTQPRDQWKAHASLDPNGVTVRESRDSTEHPTTIPVAVIFDVTGSMGYVPTELQKRLAELHGELLKKGYIEHPQILFGAVGDATCDVVPLQVGQFESDNRMDENLENLLIEQGGGGQMTESYELALYFLARHTDTDHNAKRSQKGYAFLIGDEMAYPKVKAKEVNKVFGSNVLTDDIPLADIVKEVQDKWELIFIVPGDASHGRDPRVLDFWRNTVGSQNVLNPDNVTDIAVDIAHRIGVDEGTA